MQVCLLASGSRGNALFVSTGETRLLIDAGLSLRELAARLAAIGQTAEDLDAVFLSHEHVDHLRGLGPLCRKTAMPLYIHPQTHQAAAATLGKVPRLCEFDTGHAIHFRDLCIETIPLTHDAVSPVGFIIESKEGRIGVATDLGIATRLVKERLSRCRALVLEFNHDEELLRDGPYPWPLKQRIRGSHGHLSNDAAGELLDTLLWEGLEGLFLAHMSETNNTPRHAEVVAQSVLARQNRCAPQVMLGWQHRPSDLFTTMM